MDRYGGLTTEFDRPLPDDLVADLNTSYESIETTKLIGPQKLSGEPAVPPKASSSRPQSEPKSLFSSELRSEPQSEPQSEPRAAPGAETRAETRTALRTEPWPELWPESRPKPRPKPRPEPRLEPRQETRVESRPPSQPEPFLQPQQQQLAVPHLSQSPLPEQGKSQPLHNTSHGRTNKWLLFLGPVLNIVLLGFSVCLWGYCRQLRLAHDELRLARDETIIAEALSSTLGNLALESEGAYILDGFTTPPALSSWLRWGSMFHFGAECTLRPESAECWPLNADGAIAVGLQKPSLVSLIKVNLTVSTKRRKDSASLESRISVYKVEPDGTFRQLGRSAPNTTTLELSLPAELSALVVRARISAGDSPALDAYACINGIEVYGTPTSFL